MKLDLSLRSIKECLKLAAENGENVVTNQHQRVIGKTTALIEFAIEHKYIVVVNSEAIANGLRFKFNYDYIIGIDRIHALKIIDGCKEEIVFDECCSQERIDQLVNLGFKVVTGFINEKNEKRREYYNASQCLACGYKGKIYHPSKEEYQEITICPKCSGAFVDMWKLGKYKQSNNTKEALLQISQSDVDAVPTVLYKGEQIKGKVRVSFDWKTDGHHHKSGPYIHIEHVEDSAKCINTKIIQHNYPIVEEALSNYSTEELIKALRLKEDVQITDTREDTYEVSMDLMKVKKHVLVINNCNPQLVERQRRALEVDMIRFAGSCE